MNNHGQGMALKDGGRVTDDCLPHRTRLFFSRASIAFPWIGTEVVSKRNDVVSDLRRISQPGQTTDRSNQRGRSRITTGSDETQHLPTPLTIGGDFDDVNDLRLPGGTHWTGRRVTDISKIKPTEKRPGIGHLSPKQGPCKSGPSSRNHLAASGSMERSIGKQHHVDLTTFKHVLIIDLLSDENLDFQFEVIRHVEKRVIVSLHPLGLRPSIRTDGIGGAASDQREKTQADEKSRQVEA